jgi:hypothetical protein
LSREELIGKVVRLHTKGSTRAELYLIIDDIKPSSGKITVDRVLSWIDLGLELTFYSEDK